MGVIPTRRVGGRGPLAIRISPRGRALTLVLLGSLLAGSAYGEPPSPLLHPWTPPAADSVVAWAAEARARFHTASGDSATGPNQRAFDLVGKIGLRMLRSFREDEWAQAPVIDKALDSLRLDTDVVVDPALPEFVLMMVRNPERPGAEAVGYLYWYYEARLKYQGVVFRDGFEPRMRVWWTSRQEAPYAWGILSHGPSGVAPWRLVLLHLNPNGLFWRLAQYEGGGLDLGPRGQAFWIDANSDQQPEISAWSRDVSDSSFEECSGCPGIMVERLFTQHEGGFELHDSRIVPAPWATFALFIRLLREGNRAGATRLLRDPARLADALAAGWQLNPRGTAWKLEYAEPQQAWPHWLAVRHRGVKDDPLYIVHFTTKEGRWIIRDWSRSGPAGQTPTKKGDPAK